MAIQETLYAILSGSTALTAAVDGRITPDVPTTNTQLPLLVFTAVNSSTSYATDGTATSTEHTVQIDAWGVNMTEITGIMSATRAAMVGYRDSQVMGIFLTSEATSPEEEGFHGVQTFQVWTH